MEGNVFQHLSLAKPYPASDSIPDLSRSIYEDILSPVLAVTNNF